MGSYGRCLKVSAHIPDLIGKCISKELENRHLTDVEEIEKAIRLGEYIKNGELLIGVSPLGLGRWP